MTLQLWMKWQCYNPCDTLILYRLLIFVKNEIIFTCWWKLWTVETSLIASFNEHTILKKMLVTSQLHYSMLSSIFMNGVLLTVILNHKTYFLLPVMITHMMWHKFNEFSHFCTIIVFIQILNANHLHSNFLLIEIVFRYVAPEISKSKIRMGEDEFYKEDWSGVSIQVQDLIQKLLVVDPSENRLLNKLLDTNGLWI